MAARSAGVMMLAGAALAMITVALPPHATGSDALVLILGAIVGLILRTTALLALTFHSWMLADDSDRRRGRTTP